MALISASEAAQMGICLKKVAATLGLEAGFSCKELEDAAEDLMLALGASEKMAEQGVSSYGSLLKRFKQDLGAIAAQLGIDFNGNTEQIHEAIAKLKSNNKTLDQVLAGFAKQLGFEYFDNEQVAIKIDELQERCAIADQLQADLINSDIGELRSERDYYRGLLGKLCDRLKAPDIEALEDIAKHQEMSLDFIDQHNEDLRKKLVDSQSMALKYMNRIVELEREVRSLQEPVNTISRDRDDHVDSFRYFANACKPNVPHNFDSDRLSNSELIQIIRKLLKNENHP